MELKNENFLIEKTFRTLFYIYILSELAGSLGGIVDSIIIGQLLNPISLSALNLSRPCSLLTNALAAALATGGILLYSMYTGKNDSKKAEYFFALCVNACAIAGVLITGIILISSAQVIILQGVARTASIFGDAKDYLFSSSVGTMPHMLNAVFMSMLKIHGGKKHTLIAVVIMTVSNAVMDIIAVLVFHSGMMGIGLATSFSYLFSVLYCIYYLWPKMKIFQWIPININFFRDVWSMLKYGVASGMFRVYTAFSIVIINRILMAVGGAVVVAAYSLWLGILGFIGIIGLSIGLSLATLTALFVGEEDKEGIVHLVRYAMKYGFVVSALTAIFTFVGAGSIAGVFGITANSIYFSTTVDMIHAFSIFLLPNLMLMIGINYFSAVGNVFFPNMMLVANKLVILLPVIFVMSYWGTSWLWAGFVLSEALAVMLPFVYVMLKTHKIPSLQDILFFRKEIGVPKDREFRQTIPNDLQAVMEVSRGISDFCAHHQLKHRSAMFAALCLEELLSNIVNYSYKPGEQHFIDVRIMLKENGLVIGIRNDGEEFNTVDFFEKHKTDPPYEHLGIRIIMGMSTDVKYHYLMGLNHLVVICDQAVEKGCKSS